MMEKGLAAPPKNPTPVLGSQIFFFVSDPHVSEALFFQSYTFIYKAKNCVWLQNGRLILIVRYGRDVKADKFKLTAADMPRLDDNEWHDVYFTRRRKQVFTNSIL